MTTNHALKIVAVGEDFTALAQELWKQLICIRAIMKTFAAAPNNFTLLALLVGFGLAGVAHADPITVTNFSFEFPALGGDGNSGTVPGWFLEPSVSAPTSPVDLTDFRVRNPSGAQFTGAAGNGSLPAPAAGPQALTFDDTPVLRLRTGQGSLATCRPTSPMPSRWRWGRTMSSSRLALI